MDINLQIEKATDKYISEHLQELIAKNVDSMMQSILQDIFRSYWDLGKSIKSKIESKLDINLQRFDLLDYNVIISQAINDNLLDAVNENSIKPILSLIQDTIGVVKAKEVKLSDIYEHFRDSRIQSANWELSGTFTFIVDINESYGWVTVYMDEEENVSKNSCALQFTYGNRSGNKIFQLKTDNKKISPTTIVGMGQLEREIFRYYAAQVSITTDETEFEQDWYCND